MYFFFFLKKKEYHKKYKNLKDDNKYYNNSNKRELNVFKTHYSRISHIMDTGQNVKHIHVFSLIFVVKKKIGSG